METLTSAAHTWVPELELVAPALHASGAKHPALRETGGLFIDLLLWIYLWSGILSFFTIIGIPIGIKAWQARKDWINFEENPQAFVESFGALRNVTMYY